MSSLCKWAPRAAPPSASLLISAPPCSPGQEYMETAEKVKSFLWGLDPFSCVLPPVWTVVKCAGDIVA